MSKNQYLTKTCANFSLDTETLNKFKVLSKEKAVNMSKLIENYLKEWIKNNE